MLQPKQVSRTGVACLVRALRGKVIHLVQSEDIDSDTSSMGTTDFSQPRDRSERDILGMNQGDPEQEEGEWTGRSSSPEAMDQDETLDHGVPLDEGLASEVGLAFGQRTDSQSEDMDVTNRYSESEGLSGLHMETLDARYGRGNPEPTWGEGENEAAKRRCLYPKVRPYTVPVQQDINNGWYQGEDMMDPNDAAPPAHRVGLPNVDGSIGGDQRHALPPARPTRQHSYYGRELLRRVTYDHEEKNDKGKYPHITEEERVMRTAQQDTTLQSDDHWKEELKRNHYFPAPEDSLVNFSYRAASSTYAVPYHVVGPMTWEYPYHIGQAQEDLSDHLVPASLYGLKVTYPGYCSADDKPATTAEAQATFDSGRGFVDHVGDTDMNPPAVPVGQAGHGHRRAALFVCTQPECTVAGGHELLFATLEKWAAHWNPFHVAAASAFNCMVRGCTHRTGTARDALDSLFRHFQADHPHVYDGGRWPNLTDRGLKIRGNAQYWPPTNVVGELQRPVAVIKPTSLQLESRIVAARWAARESFHKAVVARRRSRRLSATRVRVGSVALWLQKAEREPSQSPKLILSLSQQTGGPGSAALLTKLLLRLLARPSHLVLRSARAAKAHPV